jgi:hypothetical protein
MVDVHRTCDRVIPLSEASENIKSDPIIDKLSEEIENLHSTKSSSWLYFKISVRIDSTFISWSWTLSCTFFKNGDDNIEELQYQENSIHAQISQRKSKIIENFDKEEKSPT